MFYLRTICTPTAQNTGKFINCVGACNVTTMRPGFFKAVNAAGVGKEC